MFASIDDVMARAQMRAVAELATEDTGKALQQAAQWSRGTSTEWVWTPSLFCPRFGLHRRSSEVGRESHVWAKGRPPIILSYAVIRRARPTFRR